MFGLYQNIEYLLPDAAEKIIQFIGSREGEGVSTIVRRFAHTAITTFGKRVLIIDAAHHNPSQHIHYNIDGNYGWKDALNKGEPLTNACFQAGTANLFLSPLSFQTALTPQIHDRNAAVNIFDELKTDIRTHRHRLFPRDDLSREPGPVPILRRCNSCSRSREHPLADGGECERENRQKRREYPRGRLQQAEVLHSGIAYTRCCNQRQLKVLKDGTDSV